MDADAVYVCGHSRGASGCADAVEGGEFVAAVDVDGEPAGPQCGPGARAAGAKGYAGAAGMRDGSRGCWRGRSRAEREALEQFVEGFPERYVRTRPSKVIYGQFRLAQRLKSEAVQLDFEYAPETSAITLVSRDRPGSVRGDFDGAGGVGHERRYRGGVRECRGRGGGQLPVSGHVPHAGIERERARAVCGERARCGGGQGVGRGDAERAAARAAQEPAGGGGDVGGVRRWGVGERAR